MNTKQTNWIKNGEVQMKQMHESMLKAMKDGDGNLANKRNDTDNSDSY